MSKLDGFEAMDGECPQAYPSQEMLDEFIAMDVPCIGKRIETAADERLYTKMRSYIASHPEYRRRIWISRAGGMLRLIRKDMEGQDV